MAIQYATAIVLPTESNKAVNEENDCNYFRH